MGQLSKTNSEIEDPIEMNVNREELKFVKKKPGDTCKASLEKKDLSIVNTFRLVLNTLQNGLKSVLMENSDFSVHLLSPLTTQFPLAWFPLTWFLAYVYVSGEILL